MFGRMITNPHLLFRRLLLVLFIWLLYLVWMGPVTRKSGTKIPASALTPAIIKRIMTSAALKNVTTWEEFEQMSKGLGGKSEEKEVQSYVLPVFPVNDTIFKHSQYQGFRDSVAFALKYNKSVVKVPFISDSEDGPKTTTEWNKIFDDEKFSTIITSSSIETFKKNCDQSGIQVAFWSTRNLKGYDKTIQLYNDLFDIDLPSADSLAKNERESLRKIKPETTCVAFYDPEGYSDHEGTSNVAEKIDEHVVTSPQVNLMLDTFMKTVNRVCDNGMYLAMHWRNKTKEWCKEEDENGETCDSIKTKMTEITSMIASTVSNIMRESKIKCVYVAYPVGSEEIVRFLNEQIQARRRIITANDIAMQYPDEFADLECRLLAEEEISLRANKFIGWPESTWSRGIIDRRQQANKDSLYFNELPELTIVANDYRLVFDLVFS